MWIELTEQHILTALAKPEVDAYRTAAVASGQDPLAEIIATVVNEARGHIADCAKNRLAAGMTVPDRIVHHLIAIVRYRLLSRLGIPSKDERTQEYKDARRFLERVSECKVGIEWPAGEIEDDGNHQTVEVVSSSPRISTRNNLKGL